MSVTIRPVRIGHLFARHGQVMTGQISATVRERDPASGAVQPRVARVDATDPVSGRIVGWAWSDARTGAYRITGLQAGYAYSLMARHPAGAFAPAAADQVIAQEATP